MSQAEYDAQTWPIPRVLIESAIDALYEQAQHAETWRGYRNERIDVPTADAEALRAIVGPYEPLLSAEEQAARDAIFAAQMAKIERMVTDREAGSDG